MSTGDERLDAVRRLANQQSIANAQVFGDRLHVWMSDRDRAVAERRLRDAAAAAGITTTGVRHIVPSLEDVFISRIS